MVFTNKEEWKGFKEVYEVLTALEDAHEEDDALKASVFLTKLYNMGLKIEGLK